MKLAETDRLVVLGLESDSSPAFLDSNFDSDSPLEDSDSNSRVKSDFRDLGYGDWDS
jgi:hypothetical protein